MNLFKKVKIHQTSNGTIKQISIKIKLKSNIYIFKIISNGKTKIKKQKQQNKQKIQNGSK